MARLQVSEDEFREAIEEITRLSPKPGNLYSEGGADTTPYVTPDSSSITTEAFRPDAQFG